MWNLSHWKNASSYENSTQDLQSSLDPHALLQVRSYAPTLTHSLQHDSHSNTYSLLTSVAGIVMFKDVCELGFTEVLESQETEMSRYLATMFLAYCVMDLAIANVEYVVLEREAREFSIISHFHVSITSEEYHSHRAHSYRKKFTKKNQRSLEYKLDYDENLTRASRTNIGT